MNAPDLIDRAEAIAMLLAMRGPVDVPRTKKAVWVDEAIDCCIAELRDLARAPLADALAMPEIAALLGDMLEFLRGLPPDVSSGGHYNRDLRARVKQAMLGQSPLRADGYRCVAK